MSKVIVGAGGGGEKPRTPVEAPDNLRSSAYARILDLVSEGPIVGFADQTNPMRCMYYNETVVENADGSKNFDNYVIESRAGTQDQDPIPGFGGVENEIGQNFKLTAANPWVVSITNSNVDQLRIRVSTPAMMETNASNNDIGGTLVNYTVELNVDGGGYKQVHAGGFLGKTTSKYERSHVIDLPKFTSVLQVRVTRTTPDASSTSIQNDTYVESYTEIITAKLRMPMSAIISHVVEAEQFPNIPSRAAHLKGRIISVPSNYDPVTRTYTGVWDGTFKQAYTNNPAWVFYDIVTHPRYGLGDQITSAMVDKWTLYGIGVYCDELVPDGFGGMEPRFTANVYLQTRDDATRVLQNMASIFRGITYAMGGGIAALCDKPSDSVFTYTPANVIDGRFNYAGSGKKARHTVALVSWNDLDDMGRAKVEYVEDPEGIARYGVRETEVIAFGCTSRGQAHRMGKYILITEANENDTVNFGVGLDGTFVAPGRVIEIADPLRAGERMGGRILAATLTTLTVDRAPNVAAGDTITVMLADGTPCVRTLQGIAGDVLTVTAAFPSLPQEHAVWIAQRTTLKAQTFRTISVEERDGGAGYTITALKHEPGKYAAIEQGLKLQPAPITNGFSRIVMAPTGITFSQRDVYEQNVVQKIVTVDWNDTPGAVEYAYQYRHNSGNWTPMPNVKHSHVDLPVTLQEGVIEVQVFAINAAGGRSTGTVSAPYTILPSTHTPGYVDDLTADAAAAAAAAAAAQAAANAAQADADSSLATLADIAADTKLTANEKTRAKQEYEEILAEQSGIEAQGTSYALTTERNAYTAAISTLKSYLATNGLVDGSYVWIDSAVTIDIVPVHWSGYWKDVYLKRQALLNAIVAKAKTLANTAQTAADNAQAAANAANAALADIASDSVLTPGEKPLVIRENNVILTEQAGIQAQGSAYGITTELTNYNNAVSALTSYLNTLTTPYSWTNLTGNTTIEGVTFRNKFADVYTTRQALLNAIVAKGKLLSDNAQGTANAASLVKNGNFEAGSTYWGLGSGVRLESSTNVAYLGATGIVKDPNGTFSQTTSDLFAVAPGETVSASCMIRNLNGGANGEAYLTIWFYTASTYNGGGVVRSWTESANLDAGNHWRRVVGSAKVPAGTVACRIGFEVTAAHTAGYWCADDFRAEIARNYFTGSPNLVPNANFGGTNGHFAPWSIWYNPNAVPGDLRNKRLGLISGSPWTISGNVGVLEWYQNNTNPYAAEIRCSTAIPVVAGRRYQAHMKVCTHRTDASIGAVFFDNAGNYLGGAWSDYAGQGSVTGQNSGALYADQVFEAATQPQAAYNENGYDRIGLFTTAPAGATLAYFYIAKRGTLSGSDCYLWCIKPFFGEASPTQYELSPWSDAAPLDADGIGNGTSFGVVGVGDLWDSGNTRRIGLRVAGSGHRVGGPRNLPQLMVGGVRAYAAPNITYAATAGTPGPATISVSAFSVVAGDDAVVTYNGSSVGVSGNSGTTKTYYLYYDDPDSTGGSKTLNASLSLQDAASSNGRVYVGRVSVVWPTSGSGGGSGDRPL